MPTGSIAHRAMDREVSSPSSSGLTSNTYSAALDNISVTGESTTSDERERGFGQMVEIALEGLIIDSQSA